MIGAGSVGIEGFVVGGNGLIAGLRLQRAAVPGVATDCGALRPGRLRRRGRASEAAILRWRTDEFV